MLSNKLDFLMRVTSTSNSALARAISYDQSYISKIRSGKRTLPRNRDFFDQAVPYFARNLTTAYQRKAVSDVILGGSALPENRKHLENLLKSWLCSDSVFRDESIDRFLLGAPERTSGKPEAAAVRTAAPSEPDEISRVSVLPFYGNDGKRAAVELFLSRLCTSGNTHTLLLYSDEDMLWLYENADFARRWGELLTRLLKNGVSIKMIHTINRNVADLMEAVQKWMPLYLTGEIEPFYCPRLRDGLCRRSLFVAPGHSALVSNSVMTNTEGMVNLLFDDPETVRSFETEYRNFLALCRPLMRIYRGADTAEHLRTELRRYAEEEGNLYLAQSLPSVFSMPDSVLDEIASGEEYAALKAFRAESAASLSARLNAGFQVVELLNLPDPRVLRTELVSLPMWPLLGLPSFSYDARLLKEHLRSIIALSEKYANYRVILSETISPELMIMAAENTGAVLLGPLPVLFSMEEQNISTALLEYLSRIAADTTRQKSASALEAYIKQLG